MISTQPPCIGLLEHFGSGNLGDDTTVAVVLEQIRRRWPDAKVFGLSLNPPDTEARHQIPAYAVRRDRVTSAWWCPTEASPAPTGRETLLHWLATRGFLPVVNLVRECVFLSRSFRIARQFDLLIIAGGGQLLDTWGSWGFPYTLYKWVTLARLSGAKCSFVNVGAGPLDHALGRWFVKRALRQAGYISFRDAKSKSLIGELGVGGEVVADIVYGLDPDPVIERQRDGVLTVGLSPMAYCDPTRFWEKDQSVYESYIQKLADFGRYIIEAGHKVSLFSSDIWFDRQAIADLEAAIRANFSFDISDRVISEPIKDIADLLSRLANVDYSITCRYHGVVFANLMKVPVLALAHHPKISTLMSDFGLSEYCLNIRTFDAAVMTDAFERMTANANEIKDKVSQQVARYRRDLTTQFDHLFPAHGRATR